MLMKLHHWWREVRSSFWFVPSLIVVDSIVVAVALIEADSTAIDRWLARWPRLFGAGAEGAQGIMSPSCCGCSAPFKPLPV